MLVIVRKVLAPYLVPLFNELWQSRGGRLADVLTQASHRNQHRRPVLRQEASFRGEMLCTVGIAHGESVFDVSLRSGQRAVDPADRLRTTYKWG
jgi:hypothetical protein